MNDGLRMFSTLTGVTAVCGMLLAGVNELTSDKIADQRIRFATGPAIKTVLADANNDPVADRREVNINGERTMIYQGKKDSVLTGIALETKAPGYSGPVSVVSGFDPKTGTCLSIAIATSNETPGIGSQVNKQRFTQQFTGLKCTSAASLKKDGGSIDGVSGATISSRAVCKAVAKAQALYASYQQTHPNGATP